MSTLERCYPGAQIQRLMMVHIATPTGSMWYDTLVSDPDDILAIAKRGTDGIERKILMMELELLFEGHKHIAQFRPNEIL